MEKFNLDLTLEYKKKVNEIKGEPVSEEKNTKVIKINMNYSELEHIVTLFTRTGVTWYERMSYVKMLAGDTEDESGVQEFMETFLSLNTHSQIVVLEIIFSKYSQIVEDEDGHPE